MPETHVEARGESPPALSIAQQRKTLGLAAALTLPLALGTWLGVYHTLPPLAFLGSPLERLAFALRCACVAILLCFVLAIEAVSHERLFSPAIDPLAGYETRRLRINARYLQHTLEQLALFVPGLLGLGWYCADAAEARAIVATTAVWIVARFAFWVGYHRAPRFRAFGLVGLVQSVLVLLYVSCKVTHEVFGAAGIVVLLGGFFAAEAYLFIVLRRTAPP